MLKSLRKLLAPAPHIKQLPDKEIQKKYPMYRWGILESTFIGYATFYIVRNNLSVVAKEMEGALHYDHNMIGSILATTAITYGIGKFLMGSVSDRSNPRYFMPLGLFLTAICNFAFGSMENYTVHLMLWALNGFIQGMGWPPCGRSIGHWFGLKERGTVFAIWNVSHNIGGGLAGIIAAKAAIAWGWESAFYVPGAMALLCSVYLLWRLRDTPQSVGLPPIGEYKNEKQSTDGSQEEELDTRTLFVDHILRNRALWLIAAANFFVYITRYSMLDWGPMFLREVKGASLEGGGLAILVIEFGGIPSTLLMGWLSDRLGGRRGLVSFLCMIPIIAAFFVLLITPKGYIWLDFTMLALVGFFIYPPVMLLGVTALDLTSKKAVGTAAGFVGLFGYLGRTVQAKGFGWMADHFGSLYGIETGWNFVLYSILGCTLAAMILLSFTVKMTPSDAS